MSADDALSVSISVAGVFHAPQLARQVAVRGRLRQLIVGHPGWVAAGRGVPLRSVRPNVASLEFAPRLPRSIAAAVSRSSTHPLDRFDRRAAAIVSPASDIVTAWSGSARRTLERASGRGQATCLERGSTHIEVQRDLLLAEHERFAMAEGAAPDQRTIDAELAEYELATRIFVPSAFARDSFVAKGVPVEKLAVARYGVDSRFFRPLRPPPRRFIVAHVGTISARKGVHHLLRAVAELRLPDAEVRLYGDIAPEIEPLLAEYRDLLGHVGPVTRSALVEALNDASVMVLASVEEGLAMVLGEAMACGRPVVCSTSTGGADLVDDGDTGFVFDSGDDEQLQECLATLYGDRELCAEMGRRARLAAEAATWESYGDAVWGHYRAIASR